MEGCDGEVWLCKSPVLPSVLLTVRRRVVSLEEQCDALPKTLVPDAVDDDIAAAVPGHNPAGKEREVTLDVAHHIPQHKHSDWRKRRCEGKRQDADRIGCLDV